jgi:hypothetical protein
MRWLEAPRLPAWPLVLPPELPTPLPRPPPLGQGQRGCKQLLRPNGSGGSEEERRRWLRRVDGPFVLEAAPPPPLGPRRPAPRSVRGLLARPRRPTPRPRARRGASVLHHHSHRVRHHHSHHHHRACRRQQHLGTISPRGTTSSSNSIRGSGRPASRVVGRSRAPSECNPFLPLICLSCRQVFNPSFACQGFLPLCSQGRASPAPAAATETAPPGPQVPARGPTAAAPTPSGAAAAEGVPTAPTAATASTMAMPSSTPLAAAEEAPAAPTPAIEVDAGGVPSSNPPPTPEETKVIFGRRLRSGADPVGVGGARGQTPASQRLAYPAGGAHQGAVLPVRLRAVRA